jgi:RimJ/RimL family protein N-acetyltransferase
MIVAAVSRDSVAGNVTAIVVAGASRLARLWKQRGALATFRFVLTRIFRHEVHWVYAIDAGEKHPAASWTPTERFGIVTAANLATEMSPALEAFLGGPLAFENIAGIRSGDILFVVSDGGRYVHRGYALFRTRQKQLLGESEETPLISYCYTPAEIRGRALYRRALSAEIDYLRTIGHRRIAIETDPANVASQKGILAAGFRFVREVRLWILLNALIVRLSQDDAGRRLRVFVL